MPPLKRAKSCAECPRPCNVPGRADCPRLERPPDARAGGPTLCAACGRRRRCSRYAVPGPLSRWVCAACVVENLVAGCALIPWQDRDAPEGVPHEPALRPRGTPDTEELEAARATVPAPSWEDVDDEDDVDDRALRGDEVRDLILRVADILRRGDVKPGEAPGLVRAVGLLEVRLQELGG